MNAADIYEALSGLPLGDMRYYARTTSTNLQAADWAAVGAPDMALVVADEQTAGRGRLGRRWQTPAGTALAFSLVFKPVTWSSLPATHAIQRFGGLCALAVCEALDAECDLSAWIKWPNDILVDDQKIAGVLVEAEWQGDQLCFAVLGVGVNVYRGSISQGSDFTFPATSIETCLASRHGKASAAVQAIDRLALLRSILRSLITWRNNLAQDILIHAWQSRLAYRGQFVQIFQPGESQLTGQLVGLAADGALILRLSDGSFVEIYAGDLSLRPLIG